MRGAGVRTHQHSRVPTNSLRASSGYTSASLVRSSRTALFGMRRPSAPWLVAVRGVEIGLLAVGKDGDEESAGSICVKPAL
jgi:hypothetical protein